MKELFKRILRRSIPVAIVLAVMGYIFAEVFLMLEKMNGGIAQSENASVRWRTPLSMAGIGLALLAMVEVLIFAVHRNRPAAKPATPTAILDENPAHPVTR